MLKMKSVILKVRKTKNIHFSIMKYFTYKIENIFNKFQIISYKTYQNILLNYLTIHLKNRGMPFNSTKLPILATTFLIAFAHF